ncbi:MAG: hypothetical protein AAGJ18_15720 [Bacteroidota bacterium]
MKILDSTTPVVLKDFNFSTGIIEYDFEPIDTRFTSLYFRRKNEKENECFYFRTAQAGNPQAVDAIQYAPHLDGVNLWDMLFHYQSNATFHTGQWNHVKLVVSEEQMRVYINNSKNPDLTEEKLEGNTETGSIAFDGKVILSNLQITPDATENLPAKAGADLTQNDARYLRNWQVSTPFEIAEQVDFDYQYFPSDNTQWTPITAENRGLINLTRQFGGHEGREMVWLKTTIKAESDKKVRLNLGFSDDVWVFLNERLLYVDKNTYAHPIMKSPDGRCSVENTNFDVPLQEGDNELLIGVANNFFGWGIIARLATLKGLKIE